MITTTFWFKWTNQLPYSNEEQTYLGPPAHYIQKVFPFCSFTILPASFLSRTPSLLESYLENNASEVTDIFLHHGVVSQLGCAERFNVTCSWLSWQRVAICKIFRPKILWADAASNSRIGFSVFTKVILRPSRPSLSTFFSSSKKKTIYLMYGHSGDCGTDVIPLDHVPIVWCLTETWVLLADGHKPLLSWKGTCGSLLPWWQVQMSALKANKDTFLWLSGAQLGNVTPLTNQTIWKCRSSSFPST